MSHAKLIEPEQFIVKDSGKRFDIAPDPKTRIKAVVKGHGQGGKGN